MMTLLRKLCKPLYIDCTRLKYTFKVDFLYEIFQNIGD